MTTVWTEPWFELAAVRPDGSIDRLTANRFGRSVPSLFRKLSLPPGDYAVRQWLPMAPPDPCQRIVELGMLHVDGPGRWRYCGLNGPTICPGPVILRRVMK